MEIKEVLIGIGMSESEVKVYLAILKNGSSQANDIIKASSLQSSVVHSAFNSLVQKGFISYTPKNKIKFYNALPPESILNYVDSRKKSVEAIISELEALKLKSPKEKVRVEIFEGEKGMMSASLKLFENGKKGDVHKYFGVSSELLNEDVILFFDILERKRKDVGLVVKGITNIEAKKKLGNYKGLRYTKQTIPGAMSIFKDKVLFILLKEKPFLILIESEELASQYHKMWDDIWKKSA